MNKFNLEFKQIRESQKLTQKEFSKKLGISISIVAKIETGSIDISKKIAEKVVFLYPNLSNELKKYINSDSVFTKKDKNIIVSNESNLFSLVNSFAENNPVIEYYLQKIEDLKMMSKVFKNNDFADKIDIVLNSYQSVGINDIYAKLIQMYADVEITKNTIKDNAIIEKINNLEVNKDDYLNSFFVNMTAQKEWLKTTYEGLYNLYKKYITDIVKYDYSEIENLKLQNQLLEFKNKELQNEINNLKNNKVN
ncbi:helix-turn-helix domain-containing protein [Flavobacterium psychrophilum]|uniref:helix-turn-helix domain-containing protein n=1 Tax=Flavobacterium psychrophilum TaxID=96345 RepID=UPI0006187865|nr:helix-turn-helix transcriptional regulator [Flavobacterium psychrophilum]OAE94005.1 hypothetical protein SU65_01470 [Flavobacterium psychrophilum]